MRILFVRLEKILEVTGYSRSKITTVSAGRINSQLLAFDDSVRLLFTILQTTFAALEIKEAGEAPASWVTPIKSYSAASNNSFSCLLAAAAASSTDVPFRTMSWNIFSTTRWFARMPASTQGPYSMPI